MMTRLRTLICLSLLGLLSCQSAEINEQPRPPEITADKEGPCEYEIRRFDLKDSLVVQGAYDIYTVKIVTGTFEIKPCMCRVIGYELEVTSNNKTTWSLRSNLGDSIPYETWNGSLLDTLYVDDPSLIMEQYWEGEPLEVRAGFEKNGYNLNDKLVQASGLCIIENYGGMGPVGNPVFVSEPVIELITNTPPDTGTTTVAYLPIGITSPL